MVFGHFGRKLASRPLFDRRPCERVGSCKLRIAIKAWKARNAQPNVKVLFCFDCGGDLNPVQTVCTKCLASHVASRYLRSSCGCGHVFPSFRSIVSRGLPVCGFHCQCQRNLSPPAAPRLKPLPPLTPLLRPMPFVPLSFDHGFRPASLGASGSEFSPAMPSNSDFDFHQRRIWSNLHVENWLRQPSIHDVDANADSDPDIDTVLAESCP